MDHRDPDPLLKRVWLINGFLLLGLFALGLVGLGAVLLPQLLSTGSDAVVAVPGASLNGAAPRAVRFGLPKRVRGTTTELVAIHYGQDFARGSASGLGSGAGEYGLYSGGPHPGPLVNVAFLPSDGGAARLLFDDPVHIERLWYPQAEQDSLQSWISYEVVLEDSDGDGVLEQEDGATLFVSELDGSQLRRALPEGWRLVSHGPVGDGRTLVLTALPAAALQGREAVEQAQQRAFLYDVAAGSARPYVALDSAAARAGRLLAGRAQRDH